MYNMYIYNVHTELQYISKMKMSSFLCRSFANSCQSKIELKTTSDGEQLEVAAVHDDHNHENTRVSLFIKIHVHLKYTIL